MSARLAPLCAAAAAFALATAFAPGASAQAGRSSASGSSPDDFDFDKNARFDSPQHFAFELRFGPYRPDIDSAFGGLPAEERPFRQTFGNGKGFHFGVEFDWQALRLPYVGTFGPGVGWSYVSRSAEAFERGVVDEDGNRVRAGEDTTLTIMPMYAVGVLRIDYPARRFGIPLVPYAKAGLGFALWSASIESGVVTRDGVKGRGRAWGPHFALGAAFLLDVLDPSAARLMDSSVGVNNTYAYIEWMRNDLGDLFESKQMRVGTSTWVAGLALEF